MLLRKHYLLRLLIKQIHERNTNVGREQVLSLLLNQFLILACRSSIRKVLSDCHYCRQKFAESYALLMLNILNYYFDPIKVKASKNTRSNPPFNKRYRMLFICLTLTTNYRIFSTWPEPFPNQKKSC